MFKGDLICSLPDPSAFRRLSGGWVTGVRAPSPRPSSSGASGGMRRRSQAKLTDIISSVSAPGFLPVGQLLEHLTSEAPRRHPSQRPEPPRPFGAEEQQLHAELLLLRLSLRQSPARARGSHINSIQSPSFSHYPELSLQTPHRSICQSPTREQDPEMLKVLHVGQQPALTMASDSEVLKTTNTSGR